MKRADEMNRRLAEIRADPVLSRRLEALRRGEVSRVLMAWRFERMKRARMREEQRGMR